MNHPTRHARAPVRSPDAKTTLTKKDLCYLCRVINSQIRSWPKNLTANKNVLVKLTSSRSVLYDYYCRFRTYGLIQHADLKRLVADTRRSKNEIKLSESYDALVKYYMLNVDEDKRQLRPRVGPHPPVDTALGGGPVNPS